MPTKCPLKKRTCHPAALTKYEESCWFCCGIKDRKSAGGVKMDVLVLCFKSHFSNGEKAFECTPDEAAQFAALLAQGVEKFLDTFKPYKQFIKENDC